MDVQSAQVRSPTTRFHLQDLPEFTEFAFWASAFNSNGEGALSEEISTR